MRPASSRRDSSAPAALPEDAAPGGRTAVRLALAAFVGWTVFESTAARDVLWGAHHYAFYPAWMLVVAAALALVALLPFVRSFVGTPSPSVSVDAAVFPRWLPWILAALAFALFWTFRIRHLFWGDALPLSILVPQGQAFHPDEPLSLLVHQGFYRLGGGRWSGAEAIAFGSALAGAVYVGWAAHWASRTLRDPVAAALAVLALVFQGFAPLFFGYVENYTYLAVAFLFFFTTGIDVLRGTGALWRPLVAAAFAFGFHMLGGLLVVPLAFLAVRDRRRSKRGADGRALLIAAGSVVVAAVTLHFVLGAESPFARFPALVARTLGEAGRLSLPFLLSPAHRRDVFSELVLVGPLSLPLLVVLLVALPSGRAFARSDAGRFCLLAVATFLLPLLLTGEGNLGPARNWDLFAAPGVVAALAGVLAVSWPVPVRAGDTRALLTGLAAVSLFHTVPWIALNADFDRTVERVLSLPLGRGRNALMLGTHHLNAGDLVAAEQWFRMAVAEDSTNANSQSGLGVTLARRERLRDALAPMTAAVTLRPNVAVYRKDLGALHLALGDCARAVPEWRAARALAPGDVDVRIGELEALLCASEYAEAISAGEASVVAFPGNPELSARLANAYDRQVATLGSEGRFDEARAVLDAFAARFPADPRVAVLREALAR